MNEKDYKFPKIKKSKNQSKLLLMTRMVILQEVNWLL